MKYLCLPFFVLLIAAPFSASASSFCPTGIGATNGDAPKKVFNIGSNTSLLLCGWSDTNKELGQHFSEFEIVDSDTNSAVLRFGASEIVTVRQNNKKLELTEYRYYPLGLKFAYIPVPFRKFYLAADQKKISIKCDLVFSRPRFSKEEIKGIRRRYDAAKGRGPKYEDTGVLIVLAAMAGDKMLQSKLPVAVNELGLDGHYSEEFHSALRDYNEVKKGVCSENYQALLKMDLSK